MVGLGKNSRIRRLRSGLTISRTDETVVEEVIITTIKWLTLGISFSA